ncbi:DinB family protein [Streptomyces sp. NPDC017941]|uniref:DinB family protein n=1 Tax=Streptomyces sp. NPDC017941 TaxID=3365018 RepID=UPI0037A6EC1A
MPKTKTHTPKETGTEKAVLRDTLDRLRNSIAANVTGVPEPDVRTAGVPSGTNLLGLLKHLAYVERFYFLGEEPRQWGATLRPSPDDTVDTVLADYRVTVERANQVIDACQDLTAQAPRAPRRTPAPSMRWTLTHMIEETARHAGHADILRERIDGSTGH